jgi:hypothetical protein
MNMLPQNLAIDFTDEQITANGGSIFLARMAERLGLPMLLSTAIRLKQRARGASDAGTLLSLIYSLAQGDGALCDVDRLASDAARVRLLNLGCVPDSRRAGEYLTRFDAAAVDRLRTVARTVAGRLLGEVATHAQARLGYVPVFIDGSAIEVSGAYEGAAVGYDDQLRYWLHSVFVDRLWISQRLRPGNVHPADGWREQLTETAALLAGQSAVWLRADNAYYNGELVDFCRAHNWDYSLSVTSDTYKQPLKRQLDELRADDWAWLNEAQTEQAAWLAHRPAGWSDKQVYVVVRTLYDGAQRLLRPRHSFILTNRTDLPPAEIVRRHRGKQGQENAQKGPLIDLDLHHPPCRRYLANQAFYTLGQLAQLLLVALQYRVLPHAARGHGLRTIIRDLLRTPARLTRHARRWTLRFAKTAFRLDWLNHAADVLDDWARAPG